jgi:hypothetical protein
MELEFTEALSEYVWTKSQTAVESGINYTSNMVKQWSDIVVVVPPPSHLPYTKLDFSKSPPSTSPYAYVFLIGGIHTDRPGYRGFLYNVLIAAKILRGTGSKQDIWVLLQFSPDATVRNLPSKERSFLKALDVRPLVLPPAEEESFAAVVYEKFRILQFTQYKRVMFVDADIIPVANLDYLFHLTDDVGIFRPNVILATRGEPCNAGLFILQPTPMAYASLQTVIDEQHEAAKDLEYPKFDRRDGWGHNFERAGDKWDAIEESGTRWNYHASHSDQGLLFYYVKYYIQDVSIVIGNRTENWISSMPIPDKNRLPIRISTIDNASLIHFTVPEPLAWQFSCDTGKSDFYTCNLPYRDYAHFSGKRKPWQRPPEALQWLWKHVTEYPVNFDTQVFQAPWKLWFRTLIELDKQLEMNINILEWNQHLAESPLGYLAKWNDHANKVQEFHAKGE